MSSSTTARDDPALLMDLRHSIHAKAPYVGPLPTLLLGRPGLVDPGLLGGAAKVCGHADTRHKAGLQFSVPADAEDEDDEQRERRPAALLAWSWPAWALRATSAVEVLVEDPATGEHHWIRAWPEKRIVDRLGHDAFLSVQYERDNELYLEDVGPEHVRRQGSTRTVLEEGRS